MKKQRIIIALGGNAIQGKGERWTFEEQFKNINKTMECIADVLINNNYEIVITHGNGPQVGELMANTAMPIHICGAMSQSQIGYLIQQGLHNILKKRGLNKKIATVITQVAVNKNSPEFLNPTKPVGNYYSKENAQKIALETGFVFKDDSGRGYRRVVPSPEPLNIIEIKPIKTLIENGVIVICNGGGGIPVTLENHILAGIDAVIDKDRASSLLGDNLNVDMLIILTTVDKVFLNYNKPNQVALNKLNCGLADKYIKEGHFAEGSMKPKIEAAVSFVKKNKNRKALITRACSLKEALAGKNGTLITY